ncbi:Histone deacetylase 6 [Larimichthys crocea]|uniref:Uncharacterized protein n=1 Tax=Larimichthys crocea TaxID=215358 RepID=A0ACD3RDH5_LARCR|nr:Histone deacetylase 6 [Larimichthys crocea]
MKRRWIRDVVWIRTSRIWTKVGQKISTSVSSEGVSLAKGSVIRETNKQSAKQSSPARYVATTTGLVYDERMMEHMNMWDRHHPEQPQRIFKIFSKHQQLGLVDRCQRIPARLATEEELSRCHSVLYVSLHRYDNGMFFPSSEDAAPDKVPECVRASLPALKHRGKRSSKGKGRKSDKPPLPPTGQEAHSLEQLTQGLASLDISQISASHTPATSTAVGGARPKVRLSPEKVTCGGEVTLGQSQSAESMELQTQVFCGRYVNEHMVTHGVMSEHPMVLSFSDLSVWCYLCEAYVHHQILFEAKNAAHCNKFGEEIPPWT